MGAVEVEVWSEETDAYRSLHVPSMMSAWQKCKVENFFFHVPPMKVFIYIYI